MSKHGANLTVAVSQRQAGLMPAAAAPIAGQIASKAVTSPELRNGASPADSGANRAVRAIPRKHRTSLCMGFAPSTSRELCAALFRLGLHAPPFLGEAHAMELDEGEATKKEPTGMGTKVETKAANRLDLDTLDDDVGVLVRKSKSKSKTSSLAPPAKPSRKKPKSQSLAPPKRKGSRLNAFLEATRIRPSKSEPSLSESVRAKFGKAKAAAKDAVAPLAEKAVKPDSAEEPVSKTSAQPALREELDTKTSQTVAEPLSAKTEVQTQPLSSPLAREALDKPAPSSAEPSTPQLAPPIQELRRRTPTGKPAQKSKAKAPFDPGDSSPQPFTRRQTPPKKRRRQQSLYNSSAQSTLGLSWWHHHFQAPAWIGRALWIGAFACAWIALSRCMDPGISDPKLSQVPYYALLGWLLCAGLAINQRIPRRFRWTGLVLGAANSVALALSWSFRLDQL